MDRRRFADIPLQVQPCNLRGRSDQPLPYIRIPSLPPVCTQQPPHPLLFFGPFSLSPQWHLSISRYIELVVGAVRVRDIGEVHMQPGGVPAVGRYCQGLVE
ncbi:hypothetical protein SAY86_003645 [Trapa natans]|uniref:Uncharacterized protein n=1 Tax=Trapa natans TaxID=22666 RepID=A0AAN7N4C7_TRANT|nr:hypothetical protein SAY86_003645 [Trapa natans]